MIRFYGGEVRTTASAAIAHADCLELAAKTGGIFLDQFANAERATDWRGNNNIAESLPDWVIVGAGTGGTSATIGRFIRYHAETAVRTRLCVVDPEGSALYHHYLTGHAPTNCRASSVAEGIGRPAPPASFLPPVIDRMIQAPDTFSVGAMLWLEQRLGRRVGPSTGANLIAAAQLADDMRQREKKGSIATLIYDGGERYSDTVYSADWRATRNLHPKPVIDLLDSWLATGRIDLRMTFGERIAGSAPRQDDLARVAREDDIDTGLEFQRPHVLGDQPFDI
jgi:cysteine synthase